VFLYGETAGEIASLIGGRVPVHRYTAFADAFRGATETARQGDTVLLSPGCTAFGAFRDFEERGERFCQLVRELNK
jgi:UDP-N-acetylmuramoylalanine--D-glutamate ligase